MATVCLDPAFFVSSTAGDILTIAQAVTADPALPQIVDLVKEIQDLNTGSSSGTPGAPGIGLSDFVTPLKGYIFVKKHPWITAFTGLALLAVPFSLGFLVARKTGK